MPHSDPSARRSTQTLLDAVLAISSDLDLHTVLDTIVASCCEIAGAKHGFLGVLGDGGELVDYVVHGLTDDEVKDLVDRPASLGLIGHLLRHPYPIRLARASDHPADGSLPVPHAPMDSFLAMPLRVGDAVFGNLYLTGKPGGGEFTADDEAMVGALARAAGVAVDNARAYRLSERRREWVEATAQIAESLHPPFRLDATLQRIVTGVRRISRASVAAVVRGRAGDYAVAAADGPRYSALAPAVEACASTLAAAQAAGELRSVPYAEGRLVVAPLDTDLSYEGLLVLLLETGPEWCPTNDGELLTSYAAQASLALDRAESLVAREEWMLTADRDRIARELHDLVIQRLYATGLLLRGAHRLDNLADVRPRLAAAVADLDQTMRDIRAVIFELEHGHDDSLRGGVAALVREYAPALGFLPELIMTGAIDSLVDRDLREQVLAVLREALSNCVQHARASSCRVGLDVDADELVLEVADDGVGCGEEVHESGLRNLRRRATERRGAMRLRTASGGGTVLDWRVPVGD